MEGTYSVSDSPRPHSEGLDRAMWTDSQEPPSCRGRGAQAAGELGTGREGLRWPEGNIQEKNGRKTPPEERPKVGIEWWLVLPVIILSPSY